jgi:hypothetical protein
MYIVLERAQGDRPMDNKQDKEYKEQRQEGQNWAQKMYLPRGGLEDELNQDQEGNELAWANWN